MWRLCEGTHQSAPWSTLSLFSGLCQESWYWVQSSLLLIWMCQCLVIPDQYSGKNVAKVASSLICQQFHTASCHVSGRGHSSWRMWLNGDDIYIGNDRLLHCSEQNLCDAQGTVTRGLIAYYLWLWQMAVIMRPSSLGGGRILRRTLSVCPSVPL